MLGKEIDKIKEAMKDDEENETGEDRYDVEKVNELLAKEAESIILTRQEGWVDNKLKDERTDSDLEIPTESDSDMDEREHELEDELDLSDDFELEYDTDGGSLVTSNNGDDD